MTNCETVMAGFLQEADVIANCQRECFDYFACTSNANCPTNEPSRAFCDVPVGETEGVCGECVVGAFPGESGSCAVIPAGEVDAGRQICARDPAQFFPTACVPCVAADQEFQFDFGTDATAADCQLLATDFDNVSALASTRAHPRQIAQLTGHSAKVDSAWLNAPPTQTVHLIGQSAMQDSARHPFSVPSMAWAVVHRHSPCGTTLWQKTSRALLYPFNPFIFSYIIYCTSRTRPASPGDLPPSLLPWPR